MSVAENIAKIEERIQRACDSAGRKRGEVTLMAVTKFEPLEKAIEAWNAGICYFGESRVKEGVSKFETFRRDYPDAQVHLIGSLQRNKAKAAAHFYDCIQSVDREPLLEELAKHTESVSEPRSKPLEILLELHTGEETKSGFAGLDELFRAAELALNKERINVAGFKPCGLMTMAPFVNPADTAGANLIRSSFRQLVKARGELEKRFPSGDWTCLSMGMSNDFEIAIEEGATLLRIGSLIFQ